MEKRCICVLRVKMAPNVEFKCQRGKAPVQCFMIPVDYLLTMALIESLDGVDAVFYLEDDAGELVERVSSGEGTVAAHHPANYIL